MAVAPYTAGLSGAEAQGGRKSLHRSGTIVLRVHTEIDMNAKPRRQQ